MSFVSAVDTPLSRPRYALARAARVIRGRVLHRFRQSGSGPMLRRQEPRARESRTLTQPASRASPKTLRQWLSACDGPKAMDRGIRSHGNHGDVCEQEGSIHLYSAPRKELSAMYKERRCALHGGRDEDTPVLQVPRHIGFLEAEAIRPPSVSYHGTVVTDWPLISLMGLMAIDICCLGLPVCLLACRTGRQLLEELRVQGPSACAPRPTQVSTLRTGSAGREAYLARFAVDDTAIWPRLRRYAFIVRTCRPSRRIGVAAALWRPAHF